MELKLQNLNKEASTNGIIVGILSAVIGIVVFYAAPSLLGSIGFGIGSMVASILIYIFLIRIKSLCWYFFYNIKICSSAK